MATREELAVALAQYRDLYKVVAPTLSELDEKKRQVQKLALELGEGVEIDDASVGLRNGYERVGWDKGMLEGLALVYPEIEKAKKVSQVGPSAVVKVEL